MVEKIQLAVNNYYSQFEQPQQVSTAEGILAPAEEPTTAAAGVEAAVVVPAIMPGLPVEGADTDEGDASIDEEDFDNMDLNSPEETEEADEADSDNDEEISATAAVDSENAAGEALPDPVADTVGVEDEEMTS
jgi:hypothetical protein